MKNNLTIKTQRLDVGALRDNDVEHLHEPVPSGKTRHIYGWRDGCWLRSDTKKSVIPTVCLGVGDDEAPTAAVWISKRIFEAAAIADGKPAEVVIYGGRDAFERTVVAIYVDVST